MATARVARHAVGYRFAYTCVLVSLVCSRSLRCAILCVHFLVVLYAVRSVQGPSVGELVVYSIVVLRLCRPVSLKRGASARVVFRIALAGRDGGKHVQLGACMIQICVCTHACHGKWSTVVRRRQAHVSQRTHACDILVASGVVRGAKHYFGTRVNGNAPDRCS